MKSILVTGFAFSFVFLTVSGNASGQGIVLDRLMEAHGATLLPPRSVEMRGTVERGGKTEAFRLVATDTEQLRIDYGSEGKDTVVISPKATFRTDGEKIGSRSSANFAQLDVTGLFFAAQLRNRAVEVEPSNDSFSVGGAPARRIRVENERTKGLPGLPRIDDHVDLYVNEAGLLTAISRTFYEGRPERYTASFLFSGYRKTGDVWLPYRIEAYLKGRLRETFQVEQYLFDAPVSRELFEPRRPQ